MKVTPPEALTCAAFTALVQTNFRVWLDAQSSVDLKLYEVTPPRTVLVAGPTPMTSEYFALTFTGPADRFLTQGNYVFESAVLGRFDLFIVPASRDTQSATYQATFNRLVKTT